MSVRSYAILCLIYLIIIDFQSFGQSEVKNYISINTGLAAPVGNFASSENVNPVGLITSFGNPQDANSGASLLLPPTLSQSFSIEGAYYLKKFFGVAAYGAYVEMAPDVSGAQKPLNQLIAQGSGAFISQFTQGQSAQTQQLLQQLTISSKGSATNWTLATFLLGPTLSHNSGKFTFDFKVLAGITAVSTPHVDANIDFSISFLNGTLLKFDQPSISKTLFAYQVGYSVRYSVMDHIALRVYADYTASVSANYDMTVTTEMPSKDQIDFLLSLNNQPPLNANLPVAQKTRATFALTNLNVGIGLCYEFGSFSKKKKTEGEPDIELQKQQ